MNCQILIDGSNEVRLGVKNATPNSVRGQVAKEAFHHVEPGRTGGRKMEMKMRVSLLPCLHFSMLVRGVIVADHMDLPLRSGVGFDQIKKTDPLLMPMPLQAGADHFSGGNVQRRKQRGRPVALVVVGQGRGASLLEGQSWLGAIQCLNLAFFGS